MEKQDHPPAGWYPDPGGQGLRFWDGSQWGQVAGVPNVALPASGPLPASRPARSRWWIWPVAAVAVIIVLCTVVALAGYGVMRGPGKDEISGAADAVALPADFTLVNEHWVGNTLCLEDCLQLYRRYSSPSSKQQTYEIFVAALQRADFRCTDFCEGFDDAGRTLYTTWRRPGGRTLNLTVFSTADPTGAGLSLRPPLDPARQVHADVQVS